MFNFDVLNNPEPFRFYLCKPDGTVICQLNGINEESASITINLQNQHELSFEYNRYLLSNGERIESNGYHNLDIGMRILVENIGYFKIEYPPMKFDSDKETKSVSAASIECELESKDLVNFKINTGESDSLEYLVTYDEDETEALLNDYTGLPYDYIVFYNTYSEQLSSLLSKYRDGIYSDAGTIAEIKFYCDLIPRLKSKVITDNTGNVSLTEFVAYTYDKTGSNIVQIRLSKFNERISQLIRFYNKYQDQLSLLSLAVQKCNCNWSIGDIDHSLANKKYQFDIDGENIYSFLTNTLAGTARCLFSFDLYKSEINVSLLENIGKDSAVIIDKYNLLDTLTVSCDDNKIYTRYNVTGGDNLGIQYVNFGSTRIDDLSYFLNAKDEQNKRIYVSDALAEKYEQFIIDRNIVRETYIKFTKEYNQSLIDIDKMKYRVPDDIVNSDWDTFTDTALNELLVTYRQLLATLQSLYKEDYGTIGCSSDGSINENYIKNTEYWYDYYAYKITIVQIEAAIAARAKHTRYADITDKKNIHAYKTEWSLYGVVELQNKITAYNNSLQVLINSEAIILDDSKAAKLWPQLSDSEKAAYGTTESKYQYDAYMELYNEKTSCQKYLDELGNRLKELEKIRETSQTKRNQLIKLITIETYDRSALGKLVPLPPSTVSGTFTKDEIKTIHSLYMDTNYSNENILTTSLDTIVTEIDVQYELLQDAEEQLSINSQPQINFNTDIDNLLCMSEFRDFDFTVGNYVSVEYYDGYYVNLRLSSLSFNPCIPESSLTVTFTNFIKSKSERTDVSYILGQAVSGGSSNSSGGSGGNTGSLGSNKDIDVTISNTMLAKLLNTEMFGTRVSNIILDTIKVNEITSKYARFDGLVNGTTMIDGQCITTGYIVDKSYNGKNGSITNTKGTIINLDSGLFNFGGGTLKYDGTALSVKGAVSADIGYIGGASGFVIAANKLYSNNHINYNTGVDGVYIGTDCISLGSGGITYFKRDGTGKIGSWNISNNSIYFNKPNHGDASGMYFGTDGLSISDKFKVSSTGALNASGATITGNITATAITATTAGTIGCWTLNSSSIYRTNSGYGHADGMYFGTGGLSVTDKFKVSSSGALNATNATITGTVNANTLKAKSSYYICDSDFDEYIKVISSPSDNTSDTKLHFGRLTKNDYSTYLNYISFVDRSQDRECHIYSGFVETHCKLYVDGNVYATAVVANNGAGFYCGNTSGTNVKILYISSNNNCSVGNNDLNNLLLLGKTCKLTSTSGATVTSDERFKNSFKSLEEYEGFFMDLDPNAFKYNDGTSGRWHTGFRAQQVYDALIKNSLTSVDFAGYIKMYISPDDDEYRGFTDELGLIYTEFTALNTHMIQKTIHRIDVHEKEIEAIKIQLQELQNK